MSLKQEGSATRVARRHWPCAPGIAAHNPQLRNGARLSTQAIHPDDWSYDVPLIRVR
jgi:hypothetical protein